MDPLKHAPLRINDIRTKYKIIDKVGKGTYGTVFKVLNLQDNKFYAIKKFQNTQAKLQVEGFPITALREISLLKQLNHPNIINLKEIICSKPNKRNLFRGSTFMVFQYMHHDFSGLFRSKIKFSLAEIKCIMKQILQGCSFLHQNKIMHRDIKSANILLNDQGLVQLADFGLGRRTRFDNVYTYKVVTLWYRAPQLLLGCKTYNHKIDVWSIGCVFAQLLINQVLFKKQTQYALIQRIYQLCGDLEQNQFTEEFLRGCVYYHDMRPKKSSKNVLENYIKKINPQTDELSLKFLKSLLELNPYKRLSCQEALQHQFFKQSPLSCFPQDIHKLDVEYHQMFRDRSLKIERARQKRKESLDWSQEEQKKKKDRVDKKTDQYSKQYYNNDHADRHPGDNKYGVKYDKRPYERRQQINYDPPRKAYVPYDKYETKKRSKKYSNSKSYSSSSSSSSYSRSRNKRHNDYRSSEQRKRKQRIKPGYTRYENESQYSNKKYEKLYERQRPGYQKQRSINKYNDSKSDSFRKDFHQQSRYHKDKDRSDYDYKNSRNQYSSDKKQPLNRLSEKHIRQARQQNGRHQSLKFQNKEKYNDQNRNISSYHRNDRLQNGEYRGRKDQIQKYDKSHDREGRKDYSTKQYYRSSQKYDEERRPYPRQREYKDVENVRREYRNKDYNSRKISVQNKSPLQRKRTSPQRKRTSPQRKRFSPQRKRNSPQRKRFSPFKKYMDVQQY